MAIYNFGVGQVIARQNGVNNLNVAITTPTPGRFAALQDIEVDFDRDLKTLQGQYQFALDIAAGPMKISGKAKFANVQATLYNSLFFGQTLGTSGTGEQVVVDEVHTLPTGVTIAPPNTGTFIHDLGVFYQATGIELVRVASAPALGQYTVTEPGGVYAFNVSDTGSTLISYSYSSTALTGYYEIPLSNQLMGISPTFEIHLQSNYPNSVSGVVNTMNLRLNACKSSKLSLPLKNTDYQISDFDFMAYADASNTVGLLTLTQ
jgi:hypothetical protein